MKKQNRQTMAFVISIVSIVAFALPACTGGINSRTGATAETPARSPAAISSSAQVVKMASSSVSILPGQAGAAVVTLSIAPGFHINANPATFSYLIATEIQPVNDPKGEILAAKPIYPAGVKKKFEFAEEPLSVYEGDAQIKLPLRAKTPSVKGTRSLPIQLRVQACDNDKCYPPAILEAAIAIDVK